MFAGAWDKQDVGPLPVMQPMAEPSQSKLMLSTFVTSSGRTHCLGDGESSISILTSYPRSI